MSQPEQNPTLPEPPSYYFETPDHRGRMIGRRFFARSEKVARYKFRRWVAMEHGVRAHPLMIYLVDAPR